MLHLDDPHVHHDTHDMLDIPFLRLHTFQERPAHYHNGNLFRALHDKRDNRAQELLEFYANLAHLCAYDDVAVRYIERAQSADTMIRMTKEKTII